MNFYLYRIDPQPSGVLLPVFENCELQSEQEANRQADILSVLHHTPYFCCTGEDLDFVFESINPDRDGVPGSYIQQFEERDC